MNRNYWKKYYVVEGDADAVFYLTIASEIQPEEPLSWYPLAAAQARAGRTKAALASLRRAIDAGFADKTRLASDPDLEALRRDPGFPPLLDRIP